MHRYLASTPSPLPPHITTTNLVCFDFIFQVGIREPLPCTPTAIHPKPPFHHSLKTGLSNNSPQHSSVPLAAPFDPPHHPFTPFHTLLNAQFATPSPRCLQVVWPVPRLWTGRQGTLELDGGASRGARTDHADDLYTGKVELNPGGERGELLKFRLSRHLYSRRLTTSNFHPLET